MPESTPRAAPVVSRSALRVVLFGLPHAGKSSLLGAIGQAAATQEHLLDGHLADLSGGLGELQQRLYDGQPRETLEEVAPFPTVFEPFHSDIGRREVTLFDCDGRAANELLTRRRSLEGSAAGLAREVLAADALILLVDSSDAGPQMDADFAEFGRFLRFLEESRGRRSAVGGLPVFLVLSKCDLLARPDDTSAAWIERIEERKRQVHQRFQDFLAAATDRPVPFGTIQLRVWATAVRRPALADSPAKPREPFGVAELFRQAFAAASGFQKREDSSSRRLWLTAGGAAGLVAGMIALATSFVANRETQAPALGLEMRVADFKVREGNTVSRRLSGRLQDKISELRDLKRDSDFERLPAEQQDFVNQRLQELEAYRDYLDRVRAALRVTPPPPRQDEPPLDDADRERWLAQMEDLAPPAVYQQQWEDTEAVLLRAHRIADLTTLGAVVARVEGDYRDLIRKGERLRSFADWKPGDERDPAKWADWHTEGQTFLAGADKLADSSERLRPDGPPLLEIAMRFRRVQRAREDWDRLKQQLMQLRDLTAALGLPDPAPAGRPPLLRFSGIDRPPPSLDDVRERFKELQRVYPRWSEWPQMALPEAVASAIRRAADAGYRAVVSRNGISGVRPDDRNALGQKLILAQLQQVSPDDKETFAHWEEVRQWLAGNPSSLSGWRELAKLLAQLRDPRAEDPVTVLTTFLGETQFRLDLTGGLTLTLARDSDLPPTGPLTIHLISGGTTTSLTFAQRGAETADGGVKRYQFEPKGTVKPLTYRPGDTLWAELPVEKKDGKDRKLIWNTGRSLVYQFERLSKPPTLSSKPDEEQDGVKLTIRPSEEAPPLPMVPDLVPVVRLVKR